VARFQTRGHAAARAVLARAIAAERPPHALILVGPGGVGKSTLAHDLAAGLLCAAEPAERPCGVCLACRKVEHGTHPDVHRLAPEGPGGQVRLGQVHELQRDLSLLPLEGRYRVAIVEQAHRMNPDAQNALLKTLEEPPAGVCLILAVDDESTLLPTVRSRCARLALGPLSRKETADLLVERGVADASRAAGIARMAGGRPGLALAYASNHEALLVRGRIIGTLLDLARADRQKRLAAATSLIADGASLARIVDAPGPADDTPTSDGAPDAEADSGLATPPPGARRSADAAANQRPRSPAPAERRRAVTTVMDVWRHVARDVAIAAHGGLAEIGDVEALEEVLALAKDLDAAELAAFLARLEELDSAVEAYANPELVLDVLLIRWPRSRLAA
jgi:DNA polymerase-3 subunit delta'